MSQFWDQATIDYWFNCANFTSIRLSNLYVKLAYTDVFEKGHLK